MNRYIAAGIVIYTVIAVGVSAFVYKVSFESELSDDRLRGEARLADSIGRLNGQVDYYRALINFISQDPDIAAVLPSLSPAQVAERLSKIALTYGASEIDMINSEGEVLASSIARNTGFLHQKNIVRPAFNGRLGRENVLRDGTRAIQLSRLIGGARATRDRAIVITIELSDLEFDWPVSAEPIYFLDENGKVLAADRTALLLLGQNGGPTLKPRTSITDLLVPGVKLWGYDSGAVEEVQVVSRPVTQLDLGARILLTTERARQAAILRAMLVLASAIVLGLIGTLLLQQRRRIALESRHSATLETRVAERTKELKAAQNELVEASNLAALGRLSAGLSHELNQPLAAILNFAENGKRFISRDKKTNATENFSLIGDQVRRMTRIIGNLRAFARQEISPKDRVDFVAVTKSAIELAKPELEANSVELSVSLPAEDLIVVAGRVRLEQVVLNLLSNAQDAMAQSGVKQLQVKLSTAQGRALLAIRDTGTGVSAPERVFEPFYTTKELGSSKGLGMGLALSFGIIQSFDGQIFCKNHEMGAEFTVSLPRAEVK